MLTIEGDLSVETGEVSDGSVDAFLPGRPGLHFTRRYSSRNLTEGALGYGWDHNLRLSLWWDGNSMLLGGAGFGEDRLSPDPETGILTSPSRAYTVATEGPFTLVKQTDGSFWRFEEVFGQSRLRLYSREDLDGNRLVYTHTGSLLTAVTDTDGRQLRFACDSHGRVTEVFYSHPAVAGATRMAAYVYDGAGDLVQAFDRSPIPVRYEYDHHRLVTITNRKGGQTYFAYDAEGAGIARWRSDGGRARLFRRDPVQRRVEMTNSRGDRWISYLNDKNLVTRRIDPLRRVHENVYDPQGGLMMSDMKPNAIPCISVADEKERTETVVCGGHETKIQYNEFDKPVRVEAPGGRITTYEYDERGHLLKTEGADGSPVTFEYSPRGEVIALTDPRGNHTTWKIDGLHVEQSDSVGSLGLETANIFDTLQSYRDAYGNESRLRLNDAGQLAEVIFADGGIQRFGYDSAGYPLSLEHENGAQTGFESDLFGRPTGYVASSGDRYLLAWDSEDNHVEVVNPSGEVLSFDYDACDRLTSVRHYDGRRTLVENDDRDNPTRYVNPETHVETATVYGDFGKVTQRSATLAPTWEFSYGENGELVGAASELGDWKELWTKQGTWAGEHAPHRKLDIERDSLGRRKMLRDNLGLMIVYEWDIRSRLTKLVVNDRWTWTFEYDLRDLLIQAITPGDLRLRFAYDAMHRMTERTLLRAEGTMLASRRFQWTVNDDLIGIEDSRLGERRMEVDRSGRILAIRGSAEERYAHDPMHNVVVTALGEQIRLGPANRVQSAGATRFEHNGDGQVVWRISPDGETQYTYDGDGQLKSIALPNGEAIENKYDFIARRIEKSVGGESTRFFWDGAFLQGEQTGESEPVYYITLPESPIPLGMLRDGRMHILLFDQIGTLTDAFDETGRQTWAADSTAFGYLRSLTAEVEMPLRALGQYHDTETGLYYNWFRHYDPMLGRFLSADPAGYLYSQNAYWYSSNPHAWVDFDGRGSLSGGVLTLNWRCDWSSQQRQDFVDKIKAQNDHIAKNGPASKPPNFKRPCGTAAETWKGCDKGDDPEKQRPVSNKNNDPCTENDADHRMELVLGGKDNCANLAPCNASVNRSCGSQIGRVMRENPTASVTSVQAAGKCTPPDSSTTQCSSGWSPDDQLPGSDADF